MFFLFQNNVFSTVLLSATVGEERCAISESQTEKCTSTCKTACELEFTHCYVMNFTYATCSYIFYKLQVTKHFLTSPILFEGSTLINIGFFTKEHFWYVYITFISVKKFSFIYKSCKVDAITSILCKTQFWGNIWLKTWISRNWAKPHFLRKIQNFIKSERFDGFFINSIPNFVEH